MLTGGQVRAARVLLGWTQSELAEKAKLGFATIQRVEAQPGQIFGMVETILKLKTALEAAKTLGSGASDVARAAAANDLKRADTLYGALGKSCKSCHDRHRVQMPDKSFKIRP